MDSENLSQEYTPEILPRRGEYTAWLMALLLLAAAWIMYSNDIPLFFLTGFVFLLVLLAAVAISFSNWVDRNTRIRVDFTGVAYQNGLRRVVLAWDEIETITVAPGPWESRRVEVSGQNQAFRFITGGKFRQGGEIRGHTGFTQGEHILKKLIQESGLEMASDGSSKVYYYSRK